MPDPLTFHIVSLPHTQTTREYSWCAYTEKVRKFCGMMTSLGHTVFLYSGWANDARCTEHIEVVTEELHQDWFGHIDFGREVFAGWDASDTWWLRMNAVACTEISRRIQPGHIVGLIAGACQQPLADLAKKAGALAVEWGIGYEGLAEGTHRVYESWAWRHHVAGLQKGQGRGTDDVRAFDAVIPNSFEPAAFPLGQGGEDLVFMGRLIRRKGVEIAAEVARRAGRRLLLAGQGAHPDSKPGRVVSLDGMVLEGDVEHVGVLGPKERARFLGSARACLVPTTYLEPFGGVAVEAMLCGTPVITSNWGAFTETVAQGQSGWRCDTLADFLASVQATPLLNRERVRAWGMRYSVEHIRCTYEAYFRRLSTLYGAGWYELPPHLDTPSDPAAAVNA